MRAWSVLGFTGLSVASAISSVAILTTTTSATTTTASATSVSATSVSATSVSATSVSAATTTSSTSTTIVTVATDNSGQFTEIGDAITYAQSHGIPTVTVLAGTYTQAVTVSATPTVTVIGQSDTADDYTQNKVTITNAGTVLTVNNNVQQVSFKNVNFLNTASGSGVMVLKGNKYAFYDCQIVSTGTLGVTASVGLGIIGNSYIEALDKILYGSANLYVYNTKVVPVESSALLAYMKGTVEATTSILYNSTVVFDHVTVAAKSGSSISHVALASANGPGVVVLVRNSALGSLIAATGAHVDTVSQDGRNLFAEYANTGSGAYAKNAVTRAQYVSVLDASALSQYSVSAVFAAALPGYASADTTWVDSSLLAAIKNADIVQTSTSTTPTAASTVASSTIAATATSTFIVNPTAGPYKNVTAAIAALPSDGQEYTIYVMNGTYNEQISITRTGKTILRGETKFENDYTQNTVTISYSFGVLTSESRNEETPVINAKNSDGKGLAIYNINFQNTYPQTANTAALAADFYGTVQAYGCSFIGYQDTLLANKGTQVFSNCYVEGSVDFIWGFSTAYFYQSVIATNTAGSCIAAMSRSSSTATGGYVFDTCLVTYTSSYGNTYQRSWLGRPYSSYSRVVYMNSYLDKHINPAGWQVWSTSSPQTEHVTLGEFNNTGPGSWSSSRASFATNLTKTQADAYTLSNWVGGTSWLDMEAYAYVPSYTLTGTPTTPLSQHLPHVSGAVNGSYANLTDALASLPDDTTTQIIFMYAGTYEEQVPSINRNGPVMIIGYTTGNPGQSYADNEVTITFARGLSVSPLPSGHSNAETATVATASTQIAFYNLNLINSDNLDGLKPSYVTLAASIYGNHIAFYGVWFQGWQDTLLTGSKTGYQYYESSYIEGAIDFIWGYSKAYFKGCTIGAKKAKSAITAQSRASSSAIGGYIFDQSLFTAADDATVDLTKAVYLGRPYSDYALVVVKNSHLTDAINPSGWKVWSNSDPRTGAVTFAEFNNTGPGNWENNEAAREAFGYATLLTEDTYSLENVMDSTDWIDMTYWDSIDTPTIPTPIPPPTVIYNGTTPPSGAYIVSKTSLGTNTTVYDTIQSALNAIPTSSKVTPTIFIYPGTYEEQLVINKSGSVIFMGYSESTYDYSSNQVTIQYNYGVDTKADQSNSDSATVYATGNYFEAININFVNNNGTQKDIAILGFAVRSSKYASLYGCQVKGNQDALLINGYLFMSNGYVEGNIDMVWGSGAGYFLNTTISPNRDSIDLTADKRATSTTAGGFVFDQCKIIPSTGAGSMSKISLGRPWNQYARVAYIDSYLDSCVKPEGWNQWSSSSPQTSDVIFGEYGNYGPGSSTLSRATFASQLTDAEVAQFQLSTFFSTTSWIDFTHVDGTPFVPGTITTTSSAIVPSATPSSTTSSTVVSLPLVTSTTTVDVTSISTTSTFITVTPTNNISTVKSTTTLTLTPEGVTKTTTFKFTTTSTNILTEPTKTSTKTSIVTADIGSTITPDPTTVTKTSKATTTDTVTVTGKDTTKTVKSTVTSTSTITAAASTVTDKKTVTSTSVKTTTGKATKTTSTATITVGSEGTTTVSAKATTEVVTSTSTKTTTKKVTTTLSCNAAPKKIKRGLEPLDNIATVTDYVTHIDYVTKTVTTTLPVATDYITDVTTKITSLKAATVTETITSIATKLSTSTIKAVTSIVTVVDTTSIGKITTLKASTVTNTVTSLAEKHATVTLPGQTVTTASLKTAIVKTTLHLPAATTTTTVTTTMKRTTTLPASTSTVIKTSTVTNHPSVTITRRATSTSTKVVKTTSTSTMTATKTADCD
ncbi:Pectinesterase catalytic [Penicillium vulpinum]|uniref:Pectinesterase catalytic n=1 Tax=Penicillium vulpinum TaxID=29845 RepID=UPI0025488BE3|nr:Pectinesterase catalytic [Penicillium vulpinum]KAJ5972579.1 Pectinesterase catalytic [Penicillium vulpinum]